MNFKKNKTSKLDSFRKNLQSKEAQLSSKKQLSVSGKGILAIDDLMAKGIIAIDDLLG